LALATYVGISSKFRYLYISFEKGFISFIYFKYSSGVGNFPIIEAIAESSAEAKYTLAPSPNLFGKFLVDVDTTVAPARTLA
jgi:hypothetical protein